MSGSVTCSFYLRVIIIIVTKFCGNFSLYSTRFSIIKLTKIISRHQLVPSSGSRIRSLFGIVSLGRPFRVDGTVLPRLQPVVQPGQRRRRSNSGRTVGSSYRSGFLQTRLTLQLPDNGILCFIRRCTVRTMDRTATKTVPDRVPARKRPLKSRRARKEATPNCARTPKSTRLSIRPMARLSFSKVRAGGHRHFLFFFVSERFTIFENIS